MICWPISVSNADQQEYKAVADGLARCCEITVAAFLFLAVRPYKRTVCVAVPCQASFATASSFYLRKLSRIGTALGVIVNVNCSCTGGASVS
jgi:hypothetical protein